MVLGKKGSYFLFGMGPKFGPWRWAENHLNCLQCVIMSSITFFYGNYSNLNEALLNPDKMFI